MPLTNTEYRWVSHAIGVLQRVGADVTVTPPGEESQGRLDIVLYDYDPPEQPAPGEPSLVVQYLLELILSQTGLDVSGDTHIVDHLDRFVERTLRDGIQTECTLPFSFEVEGSVRTYYLTVDPQDPTLRRLLQ